MFEPKYNITNRLLQNIKVITRISTELNIRQVSDIALYDLEENSRQLSVFSSTSIEGNPLPLTEVKRLIKQKPKNLRDSEKEVLNYNEALRYIYTTTGKKKLAVEENYICTVQKKVVHILIDEYRAGKFRKEPVFVNDPRTGKHIYLPPDHHDVPSLMKDLVGFIKKNSSTVDPIILAGLFHKQFVIIHPFIDGNGRTVRLITTALLADAGFRALRLFSFENYYNRNVTNYFKYVGEFGNYYDIAADIDFTPWLEYFTDGIIDELMRVTKELERTNVTPDTVLKPWEEQILDYIEIHGFITDKDYSKLTDRAKATRALDFNHLIKLGAIERKGKGKNTYYTLV